MKDMFGFQIKEKKPKPEHPPVYFNCRWTLRVESHIKPEPCGRPLMTNYERERGLCERHQYCEDAKKAKVAYRSGKPK